MDPLRRRRRYLLLRLPRTRGDALRRAKKGKLALGEHQPVDVDRLRAAGGTPILRNALRTPVS